MNQELTPIDPVENLTSKLSKLEQMQAQIQAQMRQIQVEHELLGYRNRAACDQRVTSSVYAPTPSPESQYVPRSEFGELTSTVLSCFSALEAELKKLRLEYESYRFTAIDRRVQDLEEREKLRRELQRLQESKARSEQAPQVAAEAPVPYLTVPKQRFTEQFREKIANKQYATVEEKETVLDLLDDQLRWLGGRKSVLLEEELLGIEDSVTDEFLKHSALMSEYRDNLFALFEDITPCTPVSSDCSEDEDEDEDEDEEAERKEQKKLKRKISEEDYDSADDSMVM